MAQPVTLKAFYFGLVVVAVAGVAWIWSARSGGGPTTITEVPAGTTAAHAGYVLGSDTAPVEIIEYADFQCPACATFTILTAPDVKRRLVATGRARWRFRDFPLPSHDKALLAHHAAACAGEQNRFWPMHDQLYLQQGRWASDRRPDRVFRDYAGIIGLDLGQYDACMEEQRYAARIMATKNEGQALGVNSTPSFIVGNQLIAGSVPFDTLAAMVERAANRR